jgi:parvulin-like peptidyl-prolyl isomerase
LKRIALSIAMLTLMAATLVACGDTPAQNTPAPVSTNTPAADTSAPANTPVATPATENTPVPSTANEDDHISIQHILIGFKDAAGFAARGAPPKAQTRTQEDAKTLAYELLDRAKKGEDFDKLVTEYTDDQAPGIYNLANNGVAPSTADEYPRNQMVSAFGDVGFGLKMGDIGIADYDVTTSPFGYHIIKRVAQPATPTPETKPAGQDDHVTVQHILIGFKDAMGFQGQAPPKAQTRTQEDAKTLAYELLDRAKKGEDFEKLVTEYTDDQPPGIYSMANLGVATATPDPAATPGGLPEFPRRGLVSAFGDVGFGLKVGDISIADYDAATSPFGYHIIKRVR